MDEHNHNRFKTNNANGNQYVRITESGYQRNAYSSNPNTLDCQFDDITAWSDSLDRLPITKQPKPSLPVGDNPFAKKRPSPNKDKDDKYRRRNIKLTAYLIVIVICLLCVGAICIMMMPQVVGYFWTDFGNYAFINGELLLYENDQVSSFTQYEQYLNQDIIYPGVFVDGIYVGGMSLEEAKSAVGDENSVADTFSITINIGDKSWSLDNSNVTAVRDVDGALQKAYAVGRQNTTDILNTLITPFKERVDTVLDLRENYLYIQSEQEYDYDTVQAVIDEIDDYVTRDPVDSQILSFDFNTRTFTFSEDQAGVSIDSEALYNQVIELLESGVTNETITVQATVTFANVTQEDLENTFSLVAAYTTTTTSSSSRNNNINLACEAINGTVLLPGETFSFNDTTGQRTLAKGYQYAGAISGGELVQEVGGGVCQVSSTLFNAAARSDLEIVSRSPHAWPSTYVDKGEDATVNWPSLDFQFKNDRDTPIFIIMYYKNQKCTAEIWGVSLGDGITIDLESTVTKTLTPSSEVIYINNTDLEVGTYEETVSKRTGYVVDTYKVWYQDGVEYTREYFYTTTYKAYQQTIEYN